MKTRAHLLEAFGFAIVLATLLLAGFAQEASSDR